MPCMFERIFTLDYILLFTSICCVCAVTMLGIYGRIYLIARKHSRQIAKIHSVLGQQKQNQSQPINLYHEDEKLEECSITSKREQNSLEMNHLTIGKNSYKIQKKKSKIKKNIFLLKVKKEKKLKIIIFKNYA